VKKVHISKNPADMLSKAPPIAKFQCCLDLVGIKCLWLPFEALWRCSLWVLVIWSKVEIVGFNGPKSAPQIHQGLQRVWATDHGG